MLMQVSFVNDLEKENAILHRNLAHQQKTIQQSDQEIHKLQDRIMVSSVIMKLRIFHKPMNVEIATVVILIVLFASNMNTVVQTIA